MNHQLPVSAEYANLMGMFMRWVTMWCGNEAEDCSSEAVVGEEEPICINHAHVDNRCDGGKGKINDVYVLFCLL